MGQKLLVPVAALLLAIGAGVAIWFLMSDDSPRSTPHEGNQPADGDTPADNGPLRLNPADFEVANVKPDPITSERPPATFVASPTATRIVISGRVTTEGGIGIADARVTFHGEQQIREVRGVGYTDAGGNYTLLAWSASKPDLKQPARMGRVACETADQQIAVGEPVTVEDNISVTMPDLLVKDGATLEGQVLTSDGVPAAGVQVTVRSGGPVEVATLRGRAPSLSRRQLVKSVLADEMGRYRFSQLPPAHYALQIDSGYYGFSARAGQADLRVSLREWVDLQVTAESTVRGILRDQHGAPVPGAVVQLQIGRVRGTPTDPSNADTSKYLSIDEDRRDNGAPRRLDNVAPSRPYGSYRSVTDAGGRFGFAPIPDGEFLLAAKIGEAEVRVEGAKVGQSDYELQIDIPLSVSGTVRDAETGRVVEVYDVRVQRGGAMEVTPFDRVSTERTFANHPGGLFSTPGITGDDAVVRFSSPGYAPAFFKVETLRGGDAQVSLKPLCELRFDLVRDGAKLDLEPVALLFDNRLAYEGSSNELGRVRIPDVSPATYKVKVVLADGTQLEGELVVPAQSQATLELKLS